LASTEHAFTDRVAAAIAHGLHHIGEDELVVADREVEDGVAGFTDAVEDEAIVAEAAIEGVATESSVEGVVAEAAIEGVVAGVVEDEVVEFVAEADRGAGDFDEEDIF
jgi:hypothetical protein